MDSLSTDVTLLTIGGVEKTACQTGDATITGADGTERRYGRFSWTFGQALLNVPPNASWIAILAEMERLVAGQPWRLPLTFSGQPTRRFGVVEN